MYTSTNIAHIVPPLFGQKLESFYMYLQSFFCSCTFRFTVFLKEIENISIWLVLVLQKTSQKEIVFLYNHCLNLANTSCGRLYMKRYLQYTVYRQRSRRVWELVA
jgi:hypothetical protein